MNNKEYLSEEKVQKIKKVLIIIGCVSLIIGIGFLVASFLVKVPAMGDSGWFEAEETKNRLRFLAFPFCLMIPLVTFFLAFRREILAFNIQQTMPVAKEGIDEMAPTIGKAGASIAKEMAPVYGEVAKEISKGIKEGLKDEEK